ncbi:sortase [Psychromicrobium sp. YIM B11713]|uniref:sortase n=1 Tax=Psychromicrobium sp. YIM B11713 TaxID=3145233 RepID=UPI00374F3B92
MTALLDRPQHESQTPPVRAAAVQPAPVTQKWQWDLGLGLRMLAIVIIGLLLNLVFVSQLQHTTSQTSLFHQLRLSLAEGSVPVGEKDSEGKWVVPGTPVALLEIPQLNLSEVIVEGTTSSQTAVGVGHRRDSVLPGQSGTAVLMGRSGAYGGVFSSLRNLKAGDRFVVTTGQGKFTYQVMGSRLPGDPLPPKLAKAEGRITLISASGPAFLPSQILRVDAKLVSEPAPRPAKTISAEALPGSEQAMAQDTSGLFGMILLLQLLTAAAAAAVWSWKRWGKWQTWLVMTPILLLLSILTGGQINMLLPNLL